MKEVAKIYNWINGKEVEPDNALWIDKYDPHTGKILSKFADSISTDVSKAIEASCLTYNNWSRSTAIQRGKILTDIVNEIKRCSEDLSKCISVETGKPPSDADGEVSAAILQAEYWAGEGMRLYGRSLSSGVFGKHSHTIRQSLGVSGLIVPANTPIANIAWKCFPALICGNTVVLKASEDAPETALQFAKITNDAGLPPGVLNVIQGRGNIAGVSLVNDDRVPLISFTGSTATGRSIAEICAKRMARVSLELGGKNAFVVCADADIDHAITWASSSAFSNAGQRCASASRMLVESSIYDEFRDRLVSRAKSLVLGTSRGCDLGPVVNSRQHASILKAISQASKDNGKVICGGKIPDKNELKGGYYIEPTIIENLPSNNDLNNTEIFGPVVTLQSFSSLTDALQIVNQTKYGLTSSIHTKDVDRAFWFAQNVRAGVANVNLGTHGSEPHMPFGGFGWSGNGTREPGVEALDVYTELKNISVFVDEKNI
jgi:alpha-ketoglutaric semialdehyde dehydrogenase